MPLLWPTTLLRPLALGGAGHLTAVVRGAEVSRVIAKVGSVAALAWDDPSALTVELERKGRDRWGGSFFGGPRGNVAVSWFAHLAGAWETGPVVLGASLAPSFEVQFPWLKAWLVDRLKDVAAFRPPFPGGKELGITVAFPRSLQALPALNVQIDGIAPSLSLAGDRIGRDACLGGTQELGRLYAMNASLVGWCLAPEERDRLTRWLVEAMEVILDAARFTEFLEPACSFEESEDFNTLEVPVFLVTARFSASALAVFRSPVLSESGHLTA
ncbi:MAG: hypothetical protein HYZ13_09215 [Acidobacteria bacterium]|nr:hypothetical protein [Acidobacteriota bacterium]